MSMRIIKKNQIIYIQKRMFQNIDKEILVGNQLKKFLKNYRFSKAISERKMMHNQIRIGDCLMKKVSKSSKFVKNIIHKIY